MLKLSCFLMALFLLLTGCKKYDPVNEMLYFDIAGKYSSKTLDIQDIAEVEYLVLETNDSCLFSDFRSLHDHVAVCVNYVENSFVFFDRATGKPVSKVNRYGNGPGEYTFCGISVYSEEKDELFIFEFSGIKVYSKDGIFKRNLSFRKKSYPGPEAMYDYDAENLLFNDVYQGSINDYPTAFILISKEDGHTTEEIKIPYEKKVDYLMMKDNEGVMVGGPIPEVCFAARNGADFLLTDYSSDTVYRFTPERELVPVLIRKPSIQIMDPKILLHSWVETNSYLFFSTEKLEFDWNTQKELEKKGYLMEKHSGKIYSTDIRMKDYKGKELIIGPSVLSKTSNDRTGVIVLPVSELLDANNDGLLSGKLKEIVGRLSEDDEIILMILKFK